MEADSKIQRIERRWPVVVTILFVLFILAGIPERIRMLPTWALISVAMIQILPMIAVILLPGKPIWQKVERVITLVFCLGTTIINSVNLANIVDEVLHGSNSVSGFQLLSSGLGVWLNNVLTFSLLYWLIDRGGPTMRRNQINSPVDWLFPQEGAPHEDIPVDWKPDYIDYLFLGFCTATAFSPTDVLPLSHRAKMLMMLECLISLLTILVVFSRAVNVLT